MSSSDTREPACLVGREPRRQAAGAGGRTAPVRAVRDRGLGGACSLPGAAGGPGGPNLQRLPGPRRADAGLPELAAAAQRRGPGMRSAERPEGLPAGSGLLGSVASAGFQARVPADASVPTQADGGIWKPREAGLRRAARGVLNEPHLGALFAAEPRASRPVSTPAAVRTRPLSGAASRGFRGARPPRRSRRRGGWGWARASGTVPGEYRAGVSLPGRGSPGRSAEVGTRSRRVCARVCPSARPELHKRPCVP